MPRPDKRRRAYLEQFRRDVEGRYLYEGSFRRYTGKLPLRRALAGLWLLCAGALAALLAAGTVPAPAAMQQFYVLLPYAGALVACVSAVWTLARLTAGGDPLRSYLYDQTAARLPGRCLLAAVLAALASVGAGADAVCRGTQNAGRAIAAFLALTLGAALALTAAAALCRRMTYDEEAGR